MNDCAKIFEYETGFYFNGKKTYSIKSLGYCTIVATFFFFVSVIVIISPLISGKTVYSELKSYAFGTPADVPLKGDIIPSGLAQFFGRQISRATPMLNLDKFVEQYHQIEIYGASSCT